ncbi:hypothetical protein D9M70_489180 [compost metagenome]
MRRLRIDDDDVAGLAHDLLLTDSELRFAGMHDPGLRIGMDVKGGPLAGLGIHQEQRDGCAVLPAFKQDGSVGALLLLCTRNDMKHAGLHLRSGWLPVADELSSREDIIRNYLLVKIY